MTRNFNNRPRRYSKLIEAIAFVILILFCVWLLTACKKKDNVIQDGWEEGNTWYDNQVLNGYKTLKYKTFVSKPSNDDKGFIWNFCEEHPVETSKLRPEEKIDLDSMIITLTDTLIEDGWGRGTFNTSVRGTVKAYFVPKIKGWLKWETTELYVNTISTDGTITASCQPGESYILNINNTRVYVIPNKYGVKSSGFSYKIINKY